MARLGKCIKGVAVAGAVVFMIYSCALDAGVRVERQTVFPSCAEADGAAADSQLASLKAEQQSDWEEMNRELLYQSTVIFENAQCFPTDLVIDAKLHLSEGDDG